MWLYECIRTLYLSGRMDDQGLKAAVSRGWLSERQESHLKERKPFDSRKKECCILEDSLSGCRKI